MNYTQERICRGSACRKRCGLLVAVYEWMHYRIIGVPLCDTENSAFCSGFGLHVHHTRARTNTRQATLVFSKHACRARGGTKRGKDSGKRADLTMSTIEEVLHGERRNYHPPGDFAGRFQCISCSMCLPGAFISWTAINGPTPSGAPDTLCFFFTQTGNKMGNKK